MASRLLLGTCWLVLISGCPTRTVYYDAGMGATGGHGAGEQAGAGGKAGAGGTAGVASGGRAGGGGEKASGGADGTSARGSGGAAGNAGGTAGGGTSGQAGAAAGGGGQSTGPAGGAGGSVVSVGGAAGSNRYASGSVLCGAVTACPLTNGGKCCYAQMDQSSACQVSAASCEPVMSGTLYFAKTTIQCDSTSDCSAGQICCYTEIYIGRSTSCADPSACVDAPPPGPGGYTTYRRQVCDPNVVAPTECLSGSCKVATTYSQALPPYSTCAYELNNDW
jgi:hypothetical protein